MNSDQPERELLLKKLDTIIALLACGDNEERRIRALLTLGYSFHELSAMTGIPPGTLKTRYSVRP